MVSTELLRRYPLFANLNDQQLRELAMLTQERVVQEGETLFVEDAGADFLYLLRNGNIELHHVVVDERGMERRQDYLVGVINPGEVFGISALIHPYLYTASAIAGEASLVLELDAGSLRVLCESDVEIYVRMLERILATTRKRLQDTRVQLVP